jgi:opacity protein-like surface antigen
VATAVKYNLSLKDIRKLSGYQENARNNRPAWMIGVYFNPEVTNHHSSDLENTVSYSVGLMPQVNFNHFFIQSGLNARFTHDKGNSAVSYNRFLGTYDDVYLVTFDSTENGVIPTYYTEEVEVYDTLDHYAITETEASYTYLEIPVLFGYRYEFGKLSVFAKGGPSAAFLVRQKMPVQDPEENARIVDVDYQVPARSQINWQLMLGAGIDYRLSDRISFSLEPTFRYYLKSEYDIPDDASSKSHSFGIKAGLNYKF